MRLRAPGWRVICAKSGYEAAAEILAEPVAALLVDLRAMCARHRGLLELAERENIETFVVAGPAPADMSPSDLAGLEPLTIDKLAETLSAPAGRRAASEAPAGPPASDDQPAETSTTAKTSEARESTWAAERASSAPASAPAKPAASDGGKTPIQVPAAAPKNQTGAKGKPAPAGKGSGGNGPAQPKPKTIGRPLSAKDIAELLEQEP